MEEFGLLGCIGLTGIALRKILVFLTRVEFKLSRDRVFGLGLMKLHNEHVFVHAQAGIHADAYRC